MRNQTMCRNRLLRMIAVLSILAVLICLAAPLGVAAQQPVRMQLALIIDGSTSMRAQDFEDELYGFARGLKDVMPRDGSVEVCVIQIGVGPSADPETKVEAKLEVPPTVITDATIDGIYNAIYNPKMVRGNGYTPTADGIRLAVQQITSSPNFATAKRQVINIATDGRPDMPDGYPDPIADAYKAAEEARAAGIDELSAEAFERDGAVAFLRNLVFPQPASISPPDEMVGGFVRVVGDVGWQDLVAALKAKLEAPEPTPTDTPTVTPSATPEPPTATPTEPTEPTATPTEPTEPTATPTETPTEPMEPTATPTKPTVTPTPTPPPEIPEGNSLLLLAAGMGALASYLGLWKAGRKR